VFDFGEGQAKQANPRWSPHPIELTFDDRCAIQPAADDGSIPGQTFEPVPLPKLPQLPASSIIDVAGVVIESSELQEFVKKTGEKSHRRHLTITDGSGVSTQVTLWDARALVVVALGAVVFLRQARLSEYGGRSLSAKSSAEGVEVNPDDPRAFALQRWFQQSGGDAAALAAQARSLSGQQGSTSMPLRMLTEVQLANYVSLLAAPALGAPGTMPTPSKPGVFHRAGPAMTVMGIAKERPPFYMSCPCMVEADFAKPSPSGSGTEGRVCSKKVGLGAQGWHCAAGHVSATPLPRYVLPVTLADATMGRFYATAFDTAGVKIVGHEASVVAGLWERREQGDASAGEALDEVFRRATHKRWEMRLRSVKEEYDGKSLIKTQLLDCSPVSYTGAGATEMLTALKQALP